jgi:cytochrome P450
MSVDGKTSPCPVARDRPEFPEFDPLVSDHLRDPWPLLARARQECPVFWIPQLQMYCVTRYADVRKLHEEPDTFSNGGANMMRVPIPAGVEIPPGCPFPSVGDGLANQDGERHVRLRKLMQPAFSRSRVAKFAPQIEQIAHRLIDGFAADGKTDLVAQFANPMAMQTIATVLGFPAEDAGKFREWTDQFFFLMASPGMSESEARRLWTGLIDWYRYIEEMVRSRRTKPEDDLVSDLMATSPEEGIAPLTDAEIIANIMAFVAAGTDTTAIFITQTVRLLHAEGWWETVRNDRSRLDRVMEESLRHTGVVRGLNRVVTKDTELAGVRIPAGSVLYWMGASANRDSAQFADPDRFDPDRKGLYDHLAFSGGRHFCIGAPLARLEAKIALNAIFDRLPTLRVPDQVVEFHPNFITPAPIRLLVEWDR